MCSSIANYQTFGLTNQLADWAIFKREKKTLFDVAKLVVSAALAALALIPTFLIDCTLTITTKIYSLVCKRPTPPLIVSDEKIEQIGRVLDQNEYCPESNTLQAEVNAFRKLRSALYNELLLPVPPTSTPLTPSMVAFLETRRQSQANFEDPLPECKEIDELLTPLSIREQILFYLQIAIPSKTFEVPQTVRTLLQRLGELSTSIIQNSPQKPACEAALRA